MMSRHDPEAHTISVRIVIFGSYRSGLDDALLEGTCKPCGKRSGVSESSYSFLFWSSYIVLYSFAPLMRARDVLCDCETIPMRRTTSQSPCSLPRSTRQLKS